MPTLDNLELEIKASAENANRQLDLLIRKLGQLSNALSSVKSGDALKNVSEQAKEISSNLNSAMKESVSGATQSVQKQAKKAKESIESIRQKYEETYKDLGRGFTFAGNTDAIRKQIDKYTNALENAKLKAKELEASGKTQGTAYEKAISDIQKYSNMIDSLRSQLKQVEAPTQSVESIEALAKKAVNNFDEMGQRVREVSAEVKEDLSNIVPNIDTRTAKGQLDNLKEYLELAIQKKEELETAGATNTDVYKKEIENIETLKNKIAELSAEKQEQGIEIKVHGLEEAKRTLEEYRNSLAQFSSAIDSKEYDGVLGGLQLSLQALKQDFPEAEDMILAYEEEIKRLQGILSNFHMQQYDSNAIMQWINAREAAESYGRTLQGIRIPDLEGNFGQATAKSRFALKAFADDVKNTFRNLKITIPTDSLKNVQKEMELLKKQYDRIVDSINLKSKQIESYDATPDFKNKQIQLEEIRNRYQELIRQQEELSRVGGGGFKLNLGDFKKNLSTLESGLRRINKLLTTFAKKIISANSASKSTKSALESFNLASASLAKSILRVSNMLKLMVTRMVLRGVINGVKSGFESLIQYSDEFANSIAMLKSALMTLGNSIAAMTSPLLNALAPALTTIIKWFTAATNAVNQFFSALTGRSSWTKAKDVVASVGEAASGTAKSAKQAAKDIQKSIRAFDELKVINLPDDSASGGGGGAGTSGGGFEEAPIDDRYKKMAEFMKDMFKPLQEAWDREGKFVMDSWKYALDEVWKTVKEMGKDFADVWKQEGTIKIFQDILHIAGDIGLVIGNLALRFREAWSENETGKNILMGIRDIIGIIIGRIRDAADATVKWSEGLDFSPLLSKISEYIESLKPVFSTLSGIMLDFYNTVLLPLGQWVLEKGLPDLLDVFIRFNNEVDWGGLRSKLQEFWEHLEPFSERVGEGLILFVEDVSKAIADFVNSETFENFLKRIEKFMDNVSAEDVAKTLKKIAVAIVVLNVALAGFKTATAFVTAIDTLKSFAGIAAAIGAKIAGGVATVKTSLGLLTMDIETLLGAGTAAEIGATFGLALVGAIVAAVSGFKIGEKISEALGGETFDMSFLEQLGYIKYSFTDGSWKEAIDLWKKDLEDGWGDIIEETKKFGEELFNGLWEGIKSAFSGMKDFVGEYITGPFIEFVKDLFGIHSPSKVMKKIGGFIVDGLKQGVADKINDFINYWTTVKDNIVNKFNDIKDKFLEKGRNIVDGIKNGISEKWNAFLADWSEKKQKIIDKFNDIKEKFLTKGREIIQGIKGGISEKWSEFLVFWNEKKQKIIEKFNDIKDKFLEKGKAIIDGIKNGISNAWSAFIQFWGEKKQEIVDAFSKIYDSMTDVGKNIVNGIINGIQAVWKTLTDWAGKIKDLFSIKVDADESGTKATTSTGSTSNSTTVQGYATGGFPKSYSMFYAGENGTVEALGTVGGKTAVAGGAEITGIRDAVNETGQAEAKLLQTAVGLLEIIAEKDYGITQNDIGRAAQNFSREYMNRTGRPAYDF